MTQTYNAKGVPDPNNRDERGKWKMWSGIAKLSPQLNHVDPQDNNAIGLTPYTIVVDTGEVVPDQRFVASAWISGWYGPGGKTQTCIVESVRPLITNDKKAIIELKIQVDGHIKLYSVGYSCMAARP